MERGRIMNREEERSDRGVEGGREGRRRKNGGDGGGRKG